MQLRDDAIASLPTSGPDPWIARVVLRRTGPGGIVLVGPQQVGEDLMVLEVTPERVAQLGGPRGLAQALEPDRRRLAEGAIRAGFRGGYAVEVIIERGRRRRLWAVGGGIDA